MVTELQGRGVDGGYLAAFSHMSSLQFGRFFVSLSIFSFSYRQCGRESAFLEVYQKVLEIDEQV